MRRTLLSLIFLCALAYTQAAVTVNQAGGWFECAYVEWAPMSAYTDYNVYVRPQNGTYQMLDKPLLRSYGSYYRADALGLAAGTYQMKVVPVQNGQEVAADATETTLLTVTAHDRNGYAHFGYYGGVGAYNNDGTLKSGAKVFYVTKNTAKTITTTVKTGSKDSNITTCTGIQTIVDAYQKGYDTTPVAFRFMGLITKDDLDHISSSEEGLQVKGKKADSELNMTFEGHAIIKDSSTFIRVRLDEVFAHANWLLRWVDCFATNPTPYNL